MADPSTNIKRSRRVREAALASAAHIVLPSTADGESAPPSPTDTDPDEAFLSRGRVCELVGLSYPTIWELIRRRAFPPARKISRNRVAWLKSEITAWMRSRPCQTVKPPDTS